VRSNTRRRLSKNEALPRDGELVEFLGIARELPSQKRGRKAQSYESRHAVSETGRVATSGSCNQFGRIGLAACEAITRQECSENAAATGEFRNSQNEPRAQVWLETRLRNARLL